MTSFLKSVFASFYLSVSGVEERGLSAFEQPSGLLFLFSACVRRPDRGVIACCRWVACAGGCLSLVVFFFHFKLRELEIAASLVRLFILTLLTAE